MPRTCAASKSFGFKEHKLRRGKERVSAYFSNVNVTSFTKPGSLPQSFLKHLPEHRAEGLINEVSHGSLSRLTV